MKALFRSTANAITLARPLFGLLVIFFFFKGQAEEALWAFGVGVCTDLLDGTVARGLGITSRTGALLDPLCDKAFSITVFSLLMAYGYCPPWFLGLHIASTILQIMGWGVLHFSIESPAFEFRPSRLGRLNAAFQVFWMAVMLSDLFYPHIRIGNWVVTGAYALLASAQLAVFLTYFSSTYPTLSRLLAPLPAETA